MDHAINHNAIVHSFPTRRTCQLAQTFKPIAHEHTPRALKAKEALRRMQHVRLPLDHVHKRAAALLGVGRKSAAAKTDDEQAEGR